MRVTVTEDGPYRVEGSVPLSRQSIVPDARGESTEWSEGETLDTPASYKLCRCGQSRNKPFCDDSHLSNGFDGTETASHTPYSEQAETVSGQLLILTDAESFCSSARFCHPGGGVRRLTMSGDPSEVRHAIAEATRCPSGRLVAWDPTSGEAFETEFEPSIGLIDDPAEGVAGPLWVRGGIPIVSAEGVQYEIRNRVTLCRCGSSSNKPFCDGTHIDVKFQA